MFIMLIIINISKNTRIINEIVHPQFKELGNIRNI